METTVMGYIKVIQGLRKVTWALRVCRNFAMFTGFGLQFCLHLEVDVCFRRSMRPAETV